MTQFNPDTRLDDDVDVLIAHVDAKLAPIFDDFDSDWYLIVGA